MWRNGFVSTLSTPTCLRSDRPDPHPPVRDRFRRRDCLQSVQTRLNRHNSIELQPAGTLPSTSLLPPPDPGVDLSIEPPGTLEASGHDGAGTRYFFFVQEI